MNEALRPIKKKAGRPRLTWIEQARQDLGQIGINPDEDYANIIKQANDRDDWRTKISNLHRDGQPLESYDLATTQYVQMMMIPGNIDICLK